MTPLYPFQERALERIDTRNGRVLIAYSMGLGKAQPLDSKILTPLGWRQMGSLRPDDLVIGSDGQSTRVLAIHPQGARTVFRVHFRDGTSTRCTGDHLWSLQTPNRKWRGQPPLLLRLDDFRDDLSYANGNLKYYAPILTGPAAFNDREVPLHPYLLGYLIANGSLTQGSVGVTIPDDETELRLQELLPKGVHLMHRSGMSYSISTGRRGYGSNVVTDALRDMGLMGGYSHEKFLPWDYRFNGTEKRIQLLQGLMDGDGWVTAQSPSVPFYTTASPQLAGHFRELIESLGGTARRNVKEKPKYTHRGEKCIGRPSHSLTISLPPEIKPFLLSRKANALQPRTKYQPSRAIVKVTRCDKAECQCITVEAQNGLYLTDHCIVTHNSLIALAWLERHQAYPAVVVCPATVKYQWQVEARKHLGRRATVLEGTRAPAHLPQRRLTILNYDILRAWLEPLRELRLKTVILDESHYLANRSTRRTQAARRLCQGIPHVLALSGTPLVNRPIELWPVLNLLRPELFPSYWEYGHKWCGARRTPWGWNFNGSSHEEELHQRLRPVMIRKTKEEVLPQLPGKQEILVPLEIEDRPQYEEAQRHFLRWLASIDPLKLSRALKAERLVRIGYLRHLAAQLKLSGVVSWLDDWLQESSAKLLVFGIHRDILEQLHQRYQRTAVLVTGQITGKERQQAIAHFLAKPQKRLFLGNLKAVGVGWSAPGVSEVAFVELPWTPGAVDQAIDRVRGLGRGNGQHTTAYFLLGRKTIDEHLLRVIEDKRKTVQAILSGQGGPHEGSLLDELLRQLRQAEK